MNQTQFTGFLSSSANPGSLSLTVSSFTQAVIWMVGAYAVARGLDAQTITNNLQLLIAQTATVVATSLMMYHTGVTIWGLARKVWYALAAKKTVSGS